jgi:hypothetical protein
VSALIFVAVAVAWTAYLVPKALQHHDEVVRSRSVDRFSHTMRVLARREPVDRRSARLVVTPGRPASQAVVVTKNTSAGEPVAVVAETAAPLSRREATQRATRRRRRVLGAILLVNVAVVALAAAGVVGWWYVAVPVALLVAWLVACRLMVKQERAAAPTSRVAPAAVATPAAAEVEVEVDVHVGIAQVQPLADAVEAVEVVEVSADDETSAGIGTVAVDPQLWDPVPVTLPTYVTKPAAVRRSVRTIDLDATGVWTSGRNQADSQLAREAEQADKAAKAARKDDGRAVGS